jgi:hypothetical protein
MMIREREDAKCNGVESARYSKSLEPVTRMNQRELTKEGGGKTIREVLTSRCCDPFIARGLGFV